MAWRTITLDEQDDAIVQTYKSNEMDLFLHQSNKQRFESILATNPTDPDWVARLTTLLSDTNKRIAEVQSIVDATAMQLPDATRLQASLARLASK